MNNQVNWLQQGWECPKCGAVMSPTTSCCVNCRGNKGGGVATTSPTMINGDPIWNDSSSLCSTDSSKSAVYGKVTAYNAEDPEEQWERYQLNV